MLTVRLKSPMAKGWRDRVQHPLPLDLFLQQVLWTDGWSVLYGRPPSFIYPEDIRETSRFHADQV